MNYQSKYIQFADGSRGGLLRLKVYTYCQDLWEWLYHNSAAESFHIKNFIAEYWIKFQFYLQKRPIRFLSHPLGDLEVVMYELHL